MNLKRTSFTQFEVLRLKLPLLLLVVLLLSVTTFSTLNFNRDGRVLASSRQINLHQGAVDGYSHEVAMRVRQHNAPSVEADRSAYKLYAYAPLTLGEGRSTGEGNGAVIFVSYDTNLLIMAEKRAARINAAVSMAFMLFISILLAVLIDRTVSRRIMHLVDVANRFGRGELKIKPSGMQQDAAPENQFAYVNSPFCTAYLTSSAVFFIFIFSSKFIL